MSTTFLRLMAVTLLLASAAGGLSACTNTLDGAGKDIENAGDAVQDAAH